MTEYRKGETQQEWMLREMIEQMKEGDLFLIKLKDLDPDPSRPVIRGSRKYVTPPNAEVIVGEVHIYDYPPYEREFWVFGSEQPVPMEEAEIVDGPFTIGMITYKLDPA